jgi:hypothetical protein
MTDRDAAGRVRELGDRLKEYHDVSLDEVLEAIDYLRDPGDFVIAGGSLALGLGNHLSDLDIVVGGETTLESSRVPLEHFVKSLRVDVWKLEQRLIDEVFDRAETTLATKEALHGSFGDVDHETDLKLLHRIAHAITLDGSPPTSEKRDYAMIAREIVVREYLERLRSSAFLAQLAVAADRSIAAAINARLAVEEALNAVVHGRGMAFSGDKWLRERLAGVASDLEPVYAPFAVLPNPTDDVPGFVAKALAVCSDLTGLDLSSATLAGDAGWKTSDLSLSHVGDTDFLHSAQYGGLWELDPDEATTFQALVNRGSGPRSAEMSPCSDCDTAANRLCFLLFEHGLIQLLWATGVTAYELDIERTATI